MYLAGMCSSSRLRQIILEIVVWNPWVLVSKAVQEILSRL